MVAVVPVVVVTLVAMLHHFLEQAINLTRGVVAENAWCFYVTKVCHVDGRSLGRTCICKALDQCGCAGDLPGTIADRTSSRRICISNF